jgi:hypothetical protein
VNYDWYLDQGHDNCREELNDHEILKMAKKYDLEDEDEILRFAREVINEFGAQIKMRLWKFVWPRALYFIQPRCLSQRALKKTRITG